MTEGSGVDRRSLIKKGALIGGAVWVAPALASFNTPAAAQSSGGFSAPLYLNASFTCSAGSTSGTAIQSGANVVSFTLTPSTVAVSLSLDGTGTKLPAGTYVFWINQYPGDCPTTATAFTVTVDSNGLITAGGSASEARVNGATKFWISLVATSGGQFARSTSIP